MSFMIHGPPPVSRPVKNNALRLPRATAGWSNNEGLAPARHQGHEEQDGGLFDKHQ